MLGTKDQTSFMKGNLWKWYHFNIIDYPLSMLSFLQHIYLYNYVICKWCLLKNGAHEVRKIENGIWKKRNCCQT
jgi:hypothetical protein